MKELLIAESAGFCVGVDRSVALAEETLSRYGKAVSYGELIHNRDEIARLEERGLKTIDCIDDIPDSSVVIIRAHGIGREEENALRSKGCTVVDGTCGRVKLVHRIAERTENEGRKLIIVGDKNHPEVKGISAYCRDHVVVSDNTELENWLNADTGRCDEPISLVFQTTQTKKVYNFCENLIKLLCTNAKIFDTICFATQTRQAEAAQLSENCDAMVVVGGKHSANSRHLVRICSDKCSNVFFIENADELDMQSLVAFDTIGVTAGASVPDCILKEVKQKMCEEIKEMTNAVETEKSFAELLEESIKPIYNGDTVKGIVVAITQTEVTVDLGIKHSGYIPVEDFEDGTGVKAADVISIGDEVAACVVRVNDVEGTVMLSKRRLDAVKNWTDLEEAAENGTVVEGTVTEVNKGGVVVSVKGIRVFVPGSQSGLPKDADMEQLLKQTVRLRIREVNKGRKRVVGSIRDVSAKERHERIAKIWDEIEVGKKYEGTVKSLTSYGAFVDIGGVDGMVHVSELSWKRITKPSEVVAVGDKLEVYVISFDKENRKISLGYKDPAENPWTKFMSVYSVDSVASVTIVKLMEFGAFAEVVPGVDGLIHISQIANRRIAKPGEVLNVGDVVDAKITAIDEEKHKVSLSIRALSEPAPAPVKVEEEEVAESDALVYEISETGETTGIAPEADAE
ncbi:MAG: bifunctional 4-hydroxy-3-methylbut-2-enyl diphosphate reductase/30S ribosomal protein S1 [Ruminococcaceae bacterium]|nr:bifunctional 4-hydroxy-3-methylbut-2-enyl diphosphate reductase/30S ribosomal protein S1 [Oscillospiraceae bacterium]